MQPSFNIFWYPSTWHSIKANSLKLETIDPKNAEFWFLRKRSGNSFFATCCVWFSKKKVSWLPLLLEILGNMCNTLVCFPGRDVKNFEINLIYLIKPFFYMTKKSSQKPKYLGNEKSFYRVKQKAFFITLQRFQCLKIVWDLRGFFYLCTF